MNINPISFILAVVFIYPIIKGFLFKFSSQGLKGDIKELEGNIAFIISLFLGIYFSKKIFIEHDTEFYNKIYDIIPLNFKVYLDNNTLVYYVVVIPVMILVINRLIILIFELFNHITFYPVVDLMGKFLENKSSIFKRVSGAVFQLPKAIGYVLFITFILNILSMFNIINKYNVYLEESKLYNRLCKEVVIPVTNSKLAKQLPNILDNSFKVVIKEAEPQELNSNFVEKIGNRKVIVYYNGVTLDEAVKSNEIIDRFAKEITKNSQTTNEKAKVLYNWIGSNIDYDYEKAERVLNNDLSVKSGAIPTFQTRKGICFDYASLYIAMARANGLKARIITGEGFNGVSWVSHAWNQVYISEEGKWINVDPTFYKGGNYFNSRRFDLDHRNSKIAGEW
ncbi:transglutaminase-like domain-containing protein [Clostridium sp. SYSU_GA19001]|uniref:transglutaminase-like domain-containing protein n=1 Tax=Clostridium caldaquaticum TaxID=2940653 RepID=UPI002077154C|nr:transglutaminase-like domain-containing protein [Clostridium caldaquaticum]MCM8711658.1 transglutaminase-like domain-containing protein [Clostridium caldaquaticum]